MLADVQRERKGIFWASRANAPGKFIKYSHFAVFLEMC
jgi:hypothetical protein